MEELDILNVTEIKQKDIATINAKHLLWLSDNTKGERACFDRAFLYAIDLSDMNFSFATFRDSHITECYMSKCNMTGTNFSGARLSTVNAKDTIFDSTNFNNIAAYGTSFNSCNFSSASFSSVNFSDSNFYNANFFNAVIKNVNISNASFHNANLIIGGYDSRGYLFYAYQRLDGGITICAGCRMFYRFDDAYSHWHTRHRGNIVLSEEIMGNLDKIKRVARAKGWIE